MIRGMWKYLEKLTNEEFLQEDDFDFGDGDFCEDTYYLYRNNNDVNTVLLRHDNYVTGDGHDYWYTIINVQ